MTGNLAHSSPSSNWPCAPIKFRGICRGRCDLSVGIDITGLRREPLKGIQSDEAGLVPSVTKTREFSRVADHEEESWEVDLLFRIRASRAAPAFIVHKVTIFQVGSSVKLFGRFALVPPLLTTVRGLLPAILPLQMCTYHARGQSVLFFMALKLAASISECQLFIYFLSFFLAPAS